MVVVVVVVVVVMVMLMLKKPDNMIYTLYRQEEEDVPMNHTILKNMTTKQKDCHNNHEHPGENKDGHQPSLSV